VALDALDPRVIAIVRASSDTTSTHADIWRRVGAVTAKRGLPCPSYHAVRKIVLEERRRPSLVDPYGYVHLGGGLRVHPWTGHIAYS
jgi:hypothetical protein